MTDLAVVKMQDNTLNVLRDSLYPGSSDESLRMVIDYCKARKLDPLKKPVHLVPMSVKSGRKDSSGKDIYEFRETVMPGIGLYRIEAERSGTYAGMSEPEFGEDINETLGSVKITYPKFCKITVKKLLNGVIVEFTAKEYWKENYATKSRNDASPNAMWEKRPYGQLAKCAEAQALRKAFPDVLGQEYTKEEMEGKSFEVEKIVKLPQKIKEVIDKKEIAHANEDRDVDQDILDISWTNDLEDLQKKYKEAYTHWAKEKNKENLEKVIAAKDKRKLQIEEVTGEVEVV